MPIAELDPAETILCGLLADLESLAELPESALQKPCAFVRDFIDHGVPFDLNVWTSQPLTPARRMAFSRAAKRLEADGLVARVTDGNRDRVRYVVPTVAGLARALTLVGEKADRHAVREGLNRTRWGRVLACQLGAAGEPARSLPTQRVRTNANGLPTEMTDF